MNLPLLRLLLLASSLVGPLGPGGGHNPFIDKYLATARRHLSQGELAAARADVEKALERDDQHLGALRLEAELAERDHDLDAAIYAWYRWRNVVAAAPKSPVSRAERKAVHQHLLELDSRADEFLALREDYAAGLMALAKEHHKRGRDHSAIELYQEVLAVDPLSRAARDAILAIRRGGSSDVAVEDAYAGTDPTAGVDPEWIAAQDAKHQEWDSAWKKDGDNYRYRTDAGFLILQTSSIAMEQMNRAYRKFFRYKEDGSPTPKIEVRIFKNRDEYLELGSNPVEWSGGQFTGSAVETYVGGVSGKATILEMYGTLFHEAAHQFVSLTGRGGVPGWLNEGYASFFEGTTILSNGSVKWNQVPNYRLFPLAARMEKGWMSSAQDGVKDDSGEWATPEKAPSFRTIVSGDYEWGPPWYAPTWGVVYFLYNFRDPETGKPVFRDALHEYYLSSAAGRGDPIAHFESVVLSKQNAPLSPVRDIDALSELWHQWILDLRDEQLGKRVAGKSALQFGDTAREKGDLGLAVEFYEDAYTHLSEDPEVIWKLAQALEEQKSLDRALALYLQFVREMEMRGQQMDPRMETAREKLVKLDPLSRRHDGLKQGLKDRGLALAQSYFDRGLPTMALEIARRMSADFSLSDTLDFYTRVARRTGISLARWKVAYNEFDLTGWSGGDGYRAYGKMIEADVVPDPSIATVEGSFQTQELAADVTFDADFSLEAEMRFGKEATLMGLCFGRKDSLNFHAVVLHPKGYLDISTQNGGLWRVRDHRSVSFVPGWQKLRIDVVDDMLDVYLNGHYVRSMQMPSRDSVRGGFGLICGTGVCDFQDVRILVRDPHDPAARIERELAMEKIAAHPEARAPGSFTGLVPPALHPGEWIQGESTDLAALRGHPCCLIFWAPYQDQAIPTTEYYGELARRWNPLGMVFLAVVSSQHGPKEVRAYLKLHPMPGVRVVMDHAFETYGAYNLGAKGFGLPRILLLDVDGTVVWEGDPGFKIGVGWQPGSGETFLDGPLQTLADQRRLRELSVHVRDLERGRLLYRSGRFHDALQALAALAGLDGAEFAPEVQEARRLRTRIEAEGAQLPSLAEEALRQGHPLRAEALLQTARTEFAGLPIAALAEERYAALEKDASLRAARRAWKEFARAAKDASRGRDQATILGRLDKAAALATELPEVQEAYQALKDALFGDSWAKALPKVWQGLQPREATFSPAPSGSPQ